jgi:hypothetical protein
MDAWNESRVDQLSDWSEANYIGGGGDLGGQDDLASIAEVARYETGDTETIETKDGEVEVPV